MIGEMLHELMNRPNGTLRIEAYIVNPALLRYQFPEYLLHMK